MQDKPAHLQGVYVRGARHGGAACTVELQRRALPMEAELLRSRRAQDADAGASVEDQREAVYAGIELYSVFCGAGDVPDGGISAARGDGAGCCAYAADAAKLQSPGAEVLSLS